jgi:hypothetical protein
MYEIGQELGFTRTQTESVVQYLQDENLLENNWTDNGTIWISHDGVAQFIGLCSSLKWSSHRTKSPFLALPATAGSNAAYKIISACSNAVS